MKNAKFSLVVNGLWLVIDFFTGETGNVLFWA